MQIGYIWKALVVLLLVSTFDDTNSLGYSPRRVVYHPSASILETTSRFLAGTRKTELKLTTFSLLILVFSPIVFVDIYLSFRNLLINRTFCVRVGYILSPSFDQVEGVPQGSVLSALCFPLAINHIVAAVTDGVSVFFT